MIILEKYDYFNRSRQYSPCGAMRSDVCAAGANDAFAGSGKSDAAPCGRSDVMCSAHARSAHHLAKPNIKSEGRITFRKSGTHR